MKQSDKSDNRDEKGRVIIDSLAAVPAMSEAEEAEFWETHALNSQAFKRPEKRPEHLPTPRRSRRISIVFEDDTLERLKALAQAKGMGYQTLLKDFVTERLYEEEKRRGMVGG
jgi:predicted DNA binding CopG/RHH family protein